MQDRLVSNKDCASFFSRLVTFGQFMEFLQVRKGSVVQRDFIQVNSRLDLRKIPAQKDGAELFFGVAMRRREGGKKEDLGFVRALFADFDHMTVRQAMQRIEDAGLPEPSFAVASGHGAHAYWILERALDLQVEENLQLYEFALRRIIARTGSDTQVSAKQLLRVPGTTNYKRKPVPVHLIHKSDAVYTLEEIIDVRGFEARKASYGPPPDLSHVTGWQKFSWVQDLFAAPERYHDTALEVLAFFAKAKGHSTRAAYAFFENWWRPQGSCGSPTHRLGRALEQRLANIWNSSATWSARKTRRLLKTIGKPVEGDLFPRKRREHGHRDRGWNFRLPGGADSVRAVNRFLDGTADEPDTPIKLVLSEGVKKMFTNETGIDLESFVNFSVMNPSSRHESGERSTKWRPAEDEDVVLPKGETWFPDEKEIRKRKRNALYFAIALFQNVQLIQGLFRESRKHGGYDVGLENIALRLLNCSEQTTTIYCAPRGHAWEQLKSCGVLGCHLCGRYQYLRKILGYGDAMKEMLTAYQASDEPVYLFTLTRSLPLLTPGERARAVASLARWIRKTGLTGAWRAGGPREPSGVEDSEQWTYEARIVGHAASIDLTRAEGLAVEEGWRLRAVPLDLSDPDKTWHGVKSFVWTMPSFREPANYITWYNVMYRKHKLDAFGDWRGMEWALTLTCTVRLPNGEICGAQEWAFMPMKAIYAMPHAHGWGGYG